MSLFRYKLFSANIHNIRIAIDYFLSEAINKDNFNEIQQYAIDWSNSPGRSSYKLYIKLGYLSLTEFLHYTTDKKLIELPLQTEIIEELLKSLEEEKLIIQLSQVFGTPIEKRYKSGGELTKQLYNQNLLLNVLLGWNYIIDKYAESVIKIENIDSKGNISIGTGFYAKVKMGSRVFPYIITNKHVVETAAKINLFSNKDVPIEFIVIVCDSKRDLAYIGLKEFINESPFVLNSQLEVLSEIVTMGYPSVPMTKEAYQIYHKGEVNSFVEDYENNKLFLFSAKTSSGNSGSPIIDKYGMVVGIITEELFEKEAFYDKGKLPYYAAIPASEINESISETFVLLNG